MPYTLSPDQAEALRKIGQLYRNAESPYLTLGGYAGTGKTTLVAYLRQALRQFDDDARVAFCAYTGKAARVLTERLRDQKVPRRTDSVSTIHSLIYSASDTVTGAPVWERKATLDRDLIIVDEASMIDEPIWRDLLSFNIPILAVGDHGQLPPVGSSFSLMREPQIRLERIFRQAEDSPIIALATAARESGQLPVGEHGVGVRKLDRNQPETGIMVQELLESWRPDLLVLCGYNMTRGRLNQTIRQYRDMTTPDPQVGDRVVCLRNDRVSKLFNGMTGTLTSIKPADDDPEALWYEAEIELDGEDYSYGGFILRQQFGAAETIKDVPPTPHELEVSLTSKKMIATEAHISVTRGTLWDFGYCLTVHKAQGSQSKRVLLFEEKFSRSSEEDWRRWLYTGVTRAQEELTVIGPDPAPR